METNKYFSVIFFDDKTLVVVEKNKKVKKPAVEILSVINWLLKLLWR